MAEGSLTLRYLGPAVRISPGQDEHGVEKPYVLVGEKITLTEAQVNQLELDGHQFEGRGPRPGDPLIGMMPNYEPSPTGRPGEGVPAPPETVPPMPRRTTFGGRVAPTPKEQEKLAETYVELRERPTEAEQRAKKP